MQLGLPGALPRPARGMRALLDLLQDRVFTAQDFAELPNGICSIAAPLTHELALMLPPANLSRVRCAASQYSSADATIAMPAKGTAEHGLRPIALARPHHGRLLLGWLSGAAQRTWSASVSLRSGRREMRNVAPSHFVLTGFAVALLAGCGGSQPPIGAPGAIPQGRTVPSSYEVIYRFGKTHSGAHPLAGMIDVNGVLYGTTVGGGSSGDGTVFAITLPHTKKVLYSFRGGADGASPHAGLVSVDGELYGTTFAGGGSGCYGHHGCGTIYSVSRAGVEKVLYRFAGGSDGEAPDAGLIAVNGTLYGTTRYGGGEGCRYAEGCGTVYSVSTTGSEKVLYRFTVGGGGFPEADLLYANGRFYGTLEQGGVGCGSTGGCGCVYSVTLRGSGKVLYRFPGYPDGEHPVTPVIDVNGALYGTTSSGGTNGRGTVFTITASGSEHILVSFGGVDGELPAGGFINIHGVLYGTTAGGGLYGGGTVYRLTRVGTETVLHSFAGDSDGREPRAPVTEENGMLYGTTDVGGSKHGCGRPGCGTVFALSP